jgi:hypothetical protein
MARHKKTKDYRAAIAVNVHKHNRKRFDPEVKNVSVDPSSYDDKPRNFVIGRSCINGKYTLGGNDEI